MRLFDVIFELLKEQTDVEKAASGAQKCDATSAQDKESRELNKAKSKELGAWSKEVARQDKKDMKDIQMKYKNFLSLSYDRDSFPLDKQTRREYYSQYQQFLKNNPGIIDDGDGYTSEQKYAIVSKTLDYIRKVPQISYSVRLKDKFNLNPQSSINDVINVVNTMGGWDSFLHWFNSGGPVIK
jgi:hypothetical protein